MNTDKGRDLGVGIQDSEQTKEPTMTDFTKILKAGDKTKTKTGHEVVIYTVFSGVQIHGAIKFDSGRWEIAEWNQNGTLIYTGPGGTHHLAPPDPVQTWKNVYPRGTTEAVYRTKEDAELHRRHDDCLGAFPFYIPADIAAEMTFFE